MLYICLEGEKKEIIWKLKKYTWIYLIEIEAAGEKYWDYKLKKKIM